MPRYLTRLYVADDCAFEPKPPSSTITVTVSDDLADTGLVDAGGQRLYRVSERIPVGFLAERLK